jgi:hypothetical protein
MPVIKSSSQLVRVTLPSKGGPGFTGSQGYTGSAGGGGGYTGSQGYTGSLGYTGSAGAGYTGSAGSTGFTGSSGSLGYTGSAGAGYTGSVGSTGFTGSAGVGFTGSAGVGFTGSSGVGFTGSAGVGFTGSAGVGFTGSSGSTGFTGSEGVGYTGSLGYTGSSGVGYVGSKGDQGSQGYTGSAGAGATNITVSDFAAGVVDIDLTSVSASDDTLATAKAIKSYVDSQVSGVGDGYTGSAGATGYTGSKGDQGNIGYTGSASTVVGYTGSAGAGYTGSAGSTGFTGSQGTVGFTGSGADSPLVFTTSGIYRTLTGYTESGTTSTVRTAEFVSSALRLTLATFTPTLAAAGTPSASPNWDVAATGFTVTVTNPDDVTSDYISSVYSVTGTTGSVTGTLGSYTAGAKSNTPAATVDWTQSFTTNGSSFIRPVSSTITGGSAAATVVFNHNTGSESEYTTSNASFTITWATPTMSLSKTDKSGSTFLKTYTTTTYTASVTGITTAANYVHSITASGGTVSSGTGSGTFTFTTPIHKDNTGTTRTISNTTTFTRPIAVTGTSYTATSSSTTSSIAATFTYPSFWIFTASTGTLPTRADIIDDATGTGFESVVTQLADQTKTLTVQAINNSDANPRAFWFAVKSSASQPTTFKTGASSSLLSDVAYTNAGTISLEPDSPPAGYSSVNYNLYGITLQPGTTYVQIG